MKSLIVLVSLLGVALSRPSIGHVQFAKDGGSYSYSFQTPVVQTLLHQARYVQAVPAVQQASYVQAVPVAHSAQVVVGPAVSYSYDAVPVAAVKHVAPVVAVKNVAPANIQLSADGFVLDTEEVAKARAEHLAAFAQESARAQSEPEPIVVADNNDAIEVEAAPVAPVVVAKANFNYEPANIQVSSDGHVLDTPEVAQAKADHYARFAAEASRTSHSISYSAPNYVAYDYVQPAYQAPVVAAKPVEIANIQVSADGHVLDTPEVAQAKAEHLAQYAIEAARAEAAGGDDSESYDDGSSSAQDSDSVSIVALRAEAPIVPVVAHKVDDPPANIQLSHDGFVLDTPEVAQAKAVHLAEVAKTGSTVLSYSAPPTAASYVAYTSPSIAYTAPAVAYSAVPVAHVQPKWLGPEADIKVRSDGYLEDTPEVQQARAEHLATRASIAANSQDESSVVGATTRYAATVQGQYLLDTPEVAAARAAHLQAHAAEASKAAVAVKSYNYGQLVYNAPVYHRTVAAPAYNYFYSSPAYRFLSYRYAPTAAPVALTPDGQYLLDTPEVAAAKAEHLAAHAKAYAH